MSEKKIYIVVMSVGLTFMDLERMWHLEICFMSDQEPQVISWIGKQSKPELYGVIEAKTYGFSTEPRFGTIDESNNL